VKKLTFIFVSFFLLALYASAIDSASTIESLSRKNNLISAGKVDIVKGGYSITKHLSAAIFSPEFKMQIQIVYDSMNDKPGIFGDNWRSPQLESRVFPREKGAEWFTPWGEEIVFIEKGKDKGLYSPYSEWEATGSNGNWVISHSAGWKFEYRESHLEEITSPANRTLTFEYENKKISRIVQNNQAFVELKYSKEGIVSEVSVNGEKSSIGYVKMQASLLPEKSDLKARIVDKTLVSNITKSDIALPQQYSYDKNGFLCEVRNGQAVEKLVTQKETIEQRIAFLKKTEEANKNANKPVSVFQEVRNGRLLKDKYFDYTYTPDGTVTIKNAEGRNYSVSYNMLRGILKITDFSGLAKEYYYFRRLDVAYNWKLRQIRDSKERAVYNCQYDKKTGKPLVIKDMSGNETSYTYDKNENVTLVSRSESDNPRRPLVSFKYDENRNPITVEMLDKSGKPVYTTQLQYDQNSQVTSIETDESNHKFQYNPFGYVTRSVDTFGRAVSREYDQYNRLSSAVNADGVCIAYTYSGSRLAGIEKYSSADRKELLNSIKFSYDKNTGNLLTYSDDKGRTNKYDRNAEGRVIAQYFPDGTSVKYALDKMGRLEEVCDQNSHPIKFAYSIFGKISESVTAVGQAATYKYSQDGLLESLKKGKGGIATQEISYSYDEFDRCTRISYGNGQEKNIKYDKRGKVVRIENTESNKEDSGAHISKNIQGVDFVYDQFDRLISKNYTKTAIPFNQFASEKKEEKTTHEYSYTPSGKRKSMVVAFADGSKKVTEWSYDKFGRLEKIKDNAQEVVYKYDEKSRLAEKSLPGGLFEKYEYDSQNRLVEKVLQGRAVSPQTAEKNPQPIASLKYFYSKDGMISAREVNGKLQNYEYDLKGQLTGVKDKDGNYIEQYVYDPAGNILKKTVDGKETTFSYDNANQLATATLPDGTKKTFEYDGAGRLASERTADFAKSYEYGWLDKVLKVNENDKVTNFEYWADGQIAERLSNSKEENFTWDGLALIKRDSVNYTIEPHVNGGSPIISGNEILFNDILGSSIVSVSERKSNEINRSSFGDVSITASFKQNDFFTGKPNVEGLGYAFLFRNYKPEIGKWMSSDPLGYPDGWNNLAYCMNRPAQAVDIQGQWTLQFGFSFTGGGASGGTIDSGIALSYSAETGFSWGTYTTTGGGAYIGAGGSVTFNVTGSFNQSISALEGLSTTIGASGGEGISAGGDVNIPIDSNASTSYTVSMGVGAGFPAEQHSFLTYTFINQLNNNGSTTSGVTWSPE
jgi:RHS repeat-associated protein